MLLSFCPSGRHQRLLLMEPEGLLLCSDDAKQRETIKGQKYCLVEVRVLISACCLLIMGRVESVVEDVPSGLIRIINLSSKWHL